MINIISMAMFGLRLFGRRGQEDPLVRRFRDVLEGAPSDERTVCTEAPFIRSKAYGRIDLEFRGAPMLAPDGSGLCLEDLYEHLICFGGSGTGKTYSVLQPIWEEFFRSTHLRFGPEREQRKFGALVIEAKGDFRDKTLYLAKKYGRGGDVVLFGPRHASVYDPFGDPRETEMQQAAKLLELMKAMSGGRTGDDPFWENAARKLFLHIFLLHRAVLQGGRELEWAPEPMSFALLNLMLMDRGQPRNAAELAHCASVRRTLEEERQRAMDSLSAALLRLDVWNDRLAPFCEAEIIRRFFASCEVEGVSTGALPMPAQCRRLRQALRQWNGGEDDGIAAAGAFVLGEGLRPRIALLPEVCEAANLPHHEVLAGVLHFVEAAEQFLGVRERCLAHQRAMPVHGALKSLLEKYEKLLALRGIPVESDPIASYFHGEYWNLANDKTSGSVAMTASNVVAPLAHPPFNRIFAPNPTFSFPEAIDSGRVVYLDMPWADYKKAAEVAALVMKMDFFRAMLGRPRLLNPAGETVNQERPMVYFCDEFATVASSGEDTGEAGFLDKVREFRCACILGVQSLPMLYRRLDENEVDALLTNTAIKIFLNNTDVKTNDYASRVFGTEIKVTGSMEADGSSSIWPGGALDRRRIQTQHSRGERVRPGDFTRLRRGEAYVRLNPRFEDNQMRRVVFAGRAIGEDVK